MFAEILVDREVELEGLELVMVRNLMMIVCEVLGLEGVNVVVNMLLFGKMLEKGFEIMLAFDCMLGVRCDVEVSMEWSWMMV